ncbi:LIM-domain-containing protein [Leucogyrophana mollusca]|uniref:LIM-domain-containing protein n=1 Tax=Leucogyrophana mollusca TaxID=85980 RepID=A0ACB8BGL4_9AGAM|nr:LIM-domain-containing protein [Leucogyrophana mollusca]
MHPFGGTPICPRCNKAVYAAEQASFPSRYSDMQLLKPCLACTTCKKRLDSLTLLEHDQEVRHKTCHVRNFGTRDLRQANLPHREEVLGSPTSAPPPLPASPARSSFPTPRGNEHSGPAPRNGSRSPVRAHNTGTGRFGAMSPPPILKANSSLPPRYNRSPINPVSSLPEAEAENEVAHESSDHARSVTPVFTGTATNSGRGAGGLPRTVPLSPSKSVQDRGAMAAPVVNGTSQDTPKFSSVALGRSNSSVSAPVAPPLRPTATGTRYGVALSGGAPTSPAKQWGGGTTPVCPRCGKSVYFAEQMKAIGKTWHKGCLRCTECSTLLDSKRLTEKDGDPLCHRCYSKLHGPQGSGYALLGKAGG